MNYVRLETTLSFNIIEIIAFANCKNYNNNKLITAINVRLKYDLYVFVLLLQDRATTIFIASQNGHRAVLLTLLAEGVDPNICRCDGASPLWIAAQMGHDHIVRILLKNGAHVDAVRCVSKYW